MPQPRKSLPRYLKHSSGKARIVWTDAAGTRREKVLPGAFDSPESREAFARLQLELATSPATAAKLTVTDHGPTVVDVMLPYLRYATEYHGDGSELEAIKSAVKMARELYGMTPAGEFGPLALKATREAMVRKKWSRVYVNRQTRRVVRAFRWAVGEELVPPSVHAALKALPGLRAGKTDAPAVAPRLPADPAAVAAALPFLPPHVRAIVELLRVTGMRPAEACRMTLGQIDRSAPVWVFTLVKHKTAHRGKRRVVHLGAAARAVVVAHLGGRVLAPDEPLFSPRRQRDEWHAAKRAKRKSKVQPSQRDRSKADPKKLPGEWFTPTTVRRAVAVACKKAGVAKWSPYQLRHLVGAELRGDGWSLEHVRAALGHSHASMSSHYAAGADAVLAAEVAGKVG